MGQYRVFTIKARANDPAGEYKTWDVLFKLAEMIHREDSFPNYPHEHLEENGTMAVYTCKKRRGHEKGADEIAVNEN